MGCRNSNNWQALYCTNRNVKEFTKGRFYPKNQLKENLNLNFEKLSNGKALQFNGTKFQLSGNEENIGLLLNKNDLSINQYF